MKWVIAGVKLRGWYIVSLVLLCRWLPLTHTSLLKYRSMTTRVSHRCGHSVVSGGLSRRLHRSSVCTSGWGQSSPFAHAEYCYSHQQRLRYYSILLLDVVRRQNRKDAHHSLIASLDEQDPRPSVASDAVFPAIFFPAVCILITLHLLCLLKISYHARRKTIFCDGIAACMRAT